MSKAATTATAGSVQATVATSTARASAATQRVDVYFTAGGRLVTEARQVASSEPLRLSLEALLAGPKEAGHYSEVPRGTLLRSVQLAGGQATIDLSQRALSIEGSPAIPLFLAQIVDTATQFPTVRTVVLHVEGRPVTTLGGEGVAVPETLDRSAVKRLLSSP